MTFTIINIKIIICYFYSFLSVSYFSHDLQGVTRSASPKKANLSPDVCPRFLDDSVITSHAMNETPSTLRRSGTYTKLDSSLSPRPRRLYSSPSLGDQPMTLDDLMYEKNDPTECDTPMFTPDTSPHNQTVERCDTIVRDEEQPMVLSELADIALTPLRTADNLENLIHRYLQDSGKPNTSGKVAV